MAVRSLKDVFNLMRNNAILKKNLHERGKDDFEEDETVALIAQHNRRSTLCFKTVHSVDWGIACKDIQYEIDTINEKREELILLHNQHLTRPTLDDDVEQEHTIEMLTQEITQLFHKCNNSMKIMKRVCEMKSDREKAMMKNAVLSFAAALRQLSFDFRKKQSAYLQNIKAREDRSYRYFSPSSVLKDEDDDISDALFEQGLTRDQSMITDQNSLNIQHREEEIRSIVQSITDLSTVFQDLGQIVVEQGTVLDRIDYNVETTVLKTEYGLEEFQQADSYQRSDKKLTIILELSIILTVLLVVLIITKTTDT